MLHPCTPDAPMHRAQNENILNFLSDFLKYESMAAIRSFYLTRSLSVGVSRILFAAHRGFATATENAPEFYLDKLEGQHEGIIVFALNRPQARNAIR